MISKFQRLRGILGGGKRAALLGVGGLSALGLALSLLTQIVTSGVFGTSGELDGYWIAYSWVMLATFYVAPFREALTPAVFSRLSQDVESASKYLAAALGWLGLALAISLSAVVAVAFGVMNSAWGQSHYAHVALPLLYLAPAVIIASMAEVLNSLLSCFNRPMLQQGVRSWALGIMLITILALVKVLGVQAIAIGFVVGQTMMLVIQWRRLTQLGLRPHFAWPTMLDRSFVVLGGVLVFVYLAAQAYGVFEKLAFAHMQIGLVSAYQYAVTLTNGFITLFGAVTGTALFPSLLQSGAKGNHGEMAQLLAKACHWQIFLTAGVCTATWVLAPEIVHIIFVRGNFSAQSASMTAQALRMAVFTTIPISLTVLLGRVLLSLRHEKGMGFALVGGITAMVGMLVIAVALVIDSKTLLMAHWLLSNLAGACVSMFWVLKQLGADGLLVLRKLRPTLLIAVSALASGWLSQLVIGYFSGAFVVVLVGGSIFVSSYGILCFVSGAFPKLRTLP